MEQHPIPQHVTGYQFRLVGDMTLKQFSELAGGIILAILLSKTTIIPFFIKWPLAGLFAFGGVALAFLPFQERSLDQWLINFFKAIYSPTQYLWYKKGHIPDFLAFEPGKTAQTTISPIRPKDKKQLQAFIQTLPPQQPSFVDEQEKKALAYIKGLFGPTPTISTPKLTVSYKPAGLEPRKLKSQEEIAKEGIIFEQHLAKKVAEAKKLPQQPKKPTYLKTEISKPTVTIEPAQPLTPPLRVSSLYPPEPPKKRKPSPSKKRVGPQFASDLPMPIPPDLPNLLTGMVVGPDDRLVPNAILEIRDLKGNPVRALKTNKLGQFFIATPLRNDDYEIEVDHPNYQFDIIKLQALGKIIPPIKIKAAKEIKLKTKDQK